MLERVFTSMIKHEHVYTENGVEHFEHVLYFKIAILKLFFFSRTPDVRSLR